MINENLKITGHVKLLLNSEVIREISNLVVDAGKDFVASRMKDSNSAAMAYMGLGADSTSPVASDTALHSEVGRAVLTSTQTSGSEITYTATFAAGTATAALTEAGIFNADAGGTMLCRTVFPVVNKGASDQISIVWVITAS